jgi:hypothetical protein
MGVYLKRDFRNRLFSICYDEAGSLAELGKMLGYSTKAGVNGSVRRMWVGESPIPEKRLTALLKLAGIDSNSAQDKIVPKEQNIRFEDWVTAYTDYKTAH